jgi:WD40 repeat protein
MMTVSEDTYIRFYDIRIKKMVKDIKLEDSIRSGDFHNNGHSIAIGTSQGNLFVYDLRKDLTRVLFSGH